MSVRAWGVWGGGGGGGGWGERFDHQGGGKRQARKDGQRGLFIAGLSSIKN